MEREGGVDVKMEDVETRGEDLWCDDKKLDKRVSSVSNFYLSL